MNILILHFLGLPIFSVDIHPDGSRFATGGQGEVIVFLIYIYNIDKWNLVQFSNNARNKRNGLPNVMVSNRIIPLFVFL
jgi:protein HIRA/HIR1